MELQARGWDYTKCGSLVYGGRKFNNRRAVFEKLDRIHAHTPISRVIHGACPNTTNADGTVLFYSADMLAEEWAQAREIPYAGWPAKWHSFGHAAGPIRNQAMLDAEVPSLGCEFPGGSRNGGHASTADPGRHPDHQVVAISCDQPIATAGGGEIDFAG